MGLLALIVPVRLWEERIQAGEQQAVVFWAGFVQKEHPACRTLLFHSHHSRQAVCQTAHRLQLVQAVMTQSCQKAGLDSTAGLCHTQVGHRCLAAQTLCVAKPAAGGIQMAPECTQRSCFDSCLRCGVPLTRLAASLAMG